MAIAPGRAAVAVEVGPALPYAPTSMNEIVGLSEYIVVGVAVVLLGAALTLSRRQARLVANDDPKPAPAATADRPIRPAAQSPKACPPAIHDEADIARRPPDRPDWR